MNERSSDDQVKTALIYETGIEGDWLSSPGKESVLAKSHHGSYAIDIHASLLFKHGFKRIIVIPIIPDNILQACVDKWKGRMEIIHSSIRHDNFSSAISFWHENLRDGFVAIDAKFMVEINIMYKVLNAKSYVSCLAIFSAATQTRERAILSKIPRASIYGHKLVEFNDPREGAGDYFLGMVLFRKKVVGTLIATACKYECANIVDALSLLRKETIVHTNYTGRMIWTDLYDSNSDHDVKRIINFTKEEKSDLRAAIKYPDGFVASFFSAPIANRIVGVISKTRCEPNHITIASLLIGIAAALMFAAGSWEFMAIGGITIHLSFILDCADGQLARYKKSGSDFGGWFDSIVDRLKEYAAYFGLAYGCWINTGRYEIWPLMFLASISLAYKHLDGYYRKTLQKDQGAVSTLADVLATDKMSIMATKAKKNPFWFWLRIISTFGIGERVAVISVFAIMGRPYYALLFISIGNITSTFYNHARNWQLYYMALNRESEH